MRLIYFLFIVLNLTGTCLAENMSLAGLCKLEKTKLTSEQNSLLKVLFDSDKANCQNKIQEAIKSKQLVFDPSGIMDVQDFSFIEEFKGIEHLTVKACGNKFCEMTGVNSVSNWLPVERLKLKSLTIDDYAYFNDKTSLWSFFSSTSIPKIYIVDSYNECKFLGEQNVVLRRNRDRKQFYCNDKLITGNFEKVERLLIEQEVISDMSNPEIEEMKLESYRTGCSLNNASSCLNLGYLNLHFLNGAKEAQALYKKSCELGDGRGCYNAGGLLLQQGQYEQNSAKDYFNRACKLNIKVACKESKELEKVLREDPKQGYYKIALRLFPEQTEAARKKAVTFYERANELKSSMKTVEAIKSFKFSCDLGLSKSCNELGHLNFLPDGYHFHYQNFYEISCNMGDGDGCFFAGKSEISNRGTCCRERALEFMDIGCKFGSTVSCEIGKKLGIIIKKNHEIGRNELMQMIFPGEK